MNAPMVQQPESNPRFPVQKPRRHQLNCGPQYLKAPVTDARFEPKEKGVGKEDLFVGIDLHKQRWHVTIRTLDLEVFIGSIPVDWGSLRRLL